MSDPVWYRSLYWRIALGFVAVMAVLLVSQGLVFLWLTGRPANLLPGRSAGEYAQEIASDLSTAVAAKSDLDLDAYLNGRYRSTFRSFAVVTSDGRAVVSRSVPPPPNALRQTTGRLFGSLSSAGATLPAGLTDLLRQENPRGDRPPDFRGGDRFGDGRGGHGRDGRDGGFDGRGRGDGRGDPRGWANGQGGPGPGPMMEFAAVIVNGAPFAMVSVPIEPPPVSLVLRSAGPLLGGIALGLLAVGAAAAALVIFRPAHRRLHELQQAARALGAGESSVRAIEGGGDEVASLAHTFNEMAAGLEARTAALTEADRTRRQLLADISHELATPLASIRGYVETLGMPELRLDEATRGRYLGIVEDEAQRMGAIIGDLLELARLEGGGGSLKQEAVPVASLLERLEHRHTPALERKRIDLVLKKSPDVTTVTGDATRLEQALQNLVANAVRHTPEGGRISVTADRVAAGTRLVIEDNGAGIPAEHLPHIFDRFYKVDESRTNTAMPSGSGLGLSIVKAIVERHGGTVSAGPAAAGGARFEVVLP